jgi:AraC-like DNA-binding protein
MPKISIGAMLDKLVVTVDAVAVCDIENGCALRVEPLDQLMVHFVLKGEGSIETAAGTHAIHAGMIAIIPPGTPKIINAAGPIEKILDADKACPLSFGFLRFRAVGAGESGDLVLACASVSATLGQGLGVFDHLQQPLTEQVKDDVLSVAFGAMGSELSRPSAGSKPMVQALMTQTLLWVVRRHIARGGIRAPLYLSVTKPQLRRAFMVMTARPQDRHCLASLSRIAGMSRSRFTHHFAETYGTSPMSYLQGVRLRAAARLLQATEIPVKAVAGAVGFASRSYFSRAFAAQFGMDPSRYRDSTNDPFKYAGAPCPTDAMGSKLDVRLVRPESATDHVGRGRI